MQQNQIFESEDSDSNIFKSESNDLKKTNHLILIWKKIES